MNKGRISFYYLKQPEIHLILGDTSSKQKMKTKPRKEKKKNIVLYSNIVIDQQDSWGWVYNLKMRLDKLWQNTKAVLLDFYWQFLRALSVFFTLENGKSFCFTYCLSSFLTLT